MSQQRNQWIVRPSVSEEVYTDRDEFLEYFYNAALNAANRRTTSTVLLGQRRMGKTEIFKRVVNRLFFEQDPTSDQAVVPVYYTFTDKHQDPWKFAKDYVENFMRHYVAFYTNQPEIIQRKAAEDELLTVIEATRSRYPFTERLDWLIGWYHSIWHGKVTYPVQEALEIPRRISDTDDSTIAIFLDEFQNIYLPQHNFDIVGWIKEAVESPTCPHFVTGSAMSVLAHEILGSGSLFGRFRNKPIKPLSGYWGTQLALRTAAFYQAELSELMAPVVANHCGGNPFYITAVIQQAADSERPLLDENTIKSVLAVDISSGFIWAELHEQVSSWIKRINEFGITKWILYLSATESKSEISLERVQRELRRREGQEVTLDKIQAILIRLSRGDLVEYEEIGNTFRKVTDPILLEFLKVWGRVTVEGQDRADAQRELENRYLKRKRQIREYQGYLAEVFMSQVLLSSQDVGKQPFPGEFFNSHEDIAISRPLHYVNHQVRLSSGEGQEIDLLGAIGGDMWVCQSKWVTTTKIGVAVLEELMAQAEAVQAVYDPVGIVMWLFAYEGLTKEAEEMAHSEGILWSNRAQLDSLLKYLGLRKLPNI